MSKAQTLVIQFILFFLLGLAIFIAVGNFFKLQLDIFTGDVLTQSLKLTGSYVSSAAISLSVKCRHCDQATIALDLPKKIALHYYRINFSESGIGVAALGRPEYSFSSPHNLNYTFDFSGEAFSIRPINLTFDRANYKLEVS